MRGLLVLTSRRHFECKSKDVQNDRRSKRDADHLASVGLSLNRIDDPDDATDAGAEDADQPLSDAHLVPIRRRRQ